jgi:hypothetical protein
MDTATQTDEGRVQVPRSPLTVIWEPPIPSFREADLPGLGDYNNRPSLGDFTNRILSHTNTAPPVTAPTKCAALG